MPLLLAALSSHHLLVVSVLLKCHLTTKYVADEKEIKKELARN